ALDEVGSTYVTLLKLLIPPLVVTAVVVSIANLRQVAGAAKLAVSTLVWFAITSFVSVVIAIVLGLVIKPGVNSGVDASAAQEPSSVGSWWGFLQSIVPQNFLGLGVKISESDGAVSGSLNFNVLQLLVIAIVFGIA
ncbi:cation:dicarboxylate symporter family transporter, partial [Corynebacterium pyruviciproducens]